MKEFWMQSELGMPWTKRPKSVEGANVRTSTLCLALLVTACGAEAPTGQFSGAEEESPSALSVELVELGEGTGTVEYRLVNDSDSPQRFLPTDTAVDGATHDLFDVRLDGESVDYVGPSIYFSPPSEEDFVELAPGAMMGATINLTELYAMQVPGVYEVRALPQGPALFTGSLADVRSAELDRAPAIELSVDEAHRWQDVEERPVDKAVQQSPICMNRCLEDCGNFAGDPGAIGLCTASCTDTCNLRPSCSAAEDTALDTANAEARRLLPSAIAGIDSGQVYLDYFGIRTVPRRNLVRSVLSGVAGNREIDETRQICLDAGDTVFPGTTRTCSPLGAAGSVIIAGTNGSRGRNVAYCPIFFARSLRQRAGTVVHEATHHFGIEDIRGLTDSLVNSRVTAQNLGATDPEAAIRSAVNYQLYVTDPRF